MQPAGQQIDERLLIEAAKQDRSRFGELYERNLARVYGYVLRRVVDRSEAEDVTAEVFQHALARLDQFEWRGLPFCAWLYRIAANAIADRRRSADVSAKSSVDPAEDAAAPNVAETADLERRALVAELLNTLPPEQRRVVVGRFLEQRSIREIARELQRSEGAIKQLQFRALKSLRERLEDAHA